MIAKEFKGISHSLLVVIQICFGTKCAAAAGINSPSSTITNHSSLAANTFPERQLQNDSGVKGNGILQYPVKSNFSRYPCSFVTGKRICDQQRAVKCDHETRFIVETHGWRSGGPVALHQLALAFADAAPGRSYISAAPGRREKIPDVLWHEFEKLENLTTPLGTNSLCPGDILIVPEVARNCDISWATAAKVRVFMWQLGSMPKKIGCQYIHHNHWLAHHEGQELSRDRIITPYVSQHFIKSAHQQAGLNVLTGDISSLTSPLREKKRGLFVLIDDDVPRAVVDIIKKSTVSLGGEAVVVKGYDAPSLQSLYHRATFVFDWCMRGTERMPLEASLFGALLSTNACKSGMDFSDYPIPQALVYPGMELNSSAFQAWIMPVLARTRDEYWELLSSFAPMRLRILAYDRKSMAEEARRFIAFEYSREKPLPGEHMSLEEYFAGTPEQPPYKPTPNSV